MTIAEVFLVGLGVWFPGRLAISEMIGWYRYPERKSNVPTTAHWWRERARMRSAGALPRHRIQQSLVRAMAQTVVEGLSLLLPERTYPPGRHAIK